MLKRPFSTCGLPMKAIFNVRLGRWFCMARCIGIDVSRGLVCARLISLPAYFIFLPPIQLNSTCGSIFNGNETDSTEASICIGCLFSANFCTCCALGPHVTVWDSSCVVPSSFPHVMYPYLGIGSLVLE